MPQYLSPGVYVEEIDSGARPIEGVGTAVAAFIGLAEKGPFNKPILCSNWTQFTKTFGGFIEGASLARSVFGFFQNGGGNSYIVRIGDGAGENGHGSHQQPAIEAAPQGVLANLRVVALDPAAPRDSIKVEIVEFQHEGQDGQEGARALKLVVERDGQTVEEHHDITAGRGKTNVVTVVNAASQVIRLEQIAGKGLEELHSGMRVALAAPSEMAVATPPARLSADDYVGDVSERTGVSGLEAIDEVTMVCMPDLMTAYQRGAVDLETVQTVQLAMIAHCELMGDRVAILDAPPGLNVQQIKEWRVDKAGYDSKYATLYYPWIKCRWGRVPAAIGIHRRHLGPQR